MHAICGHNGAGKSTLVKALVGLVKPDEGVIRFDGEELSLRNPHEAQAHGIALVNQELSLVPELSVEDNIFLGGLDVPLALPAGAASPSRRARVLDQLGLRHVQLGTAVETLSIGERQLVEIARLLVRDARLLILDEPTATLSKPEIERVFRATRDLVAQGAERHLRVAPARRGLRAVRPRHGAARRRARRDARDPRDRPALADRAHARRDGGREDAGRARARRCPASGAAVVRIDRLHVPGSVDERVAHARERDHHRPRGPGRLRHEHVLRALGGLVPNASGTIEVNGEKVLLSTPRRAADAGVLYIPNDRQREGLFLGQSVERNLTVTRLRRLSRLGVLLRRRVQRTARELAAMAAVSARPARLAGRRASAAATSRRCCSAGRCSSTARRCSRSTSRRAASTSAGRAEIHNLLREAARNGHGRDLLLDGARRDPRPRGRRRHDLRAAGSSRSSRGRRRRASAILADMTTSHARAGGAPS